MKKIILIISLIFALISCSINDTEEQEKLNIVASIVPIASITNYIGGTEVDVFSIVPAGVSPHSFDLTPQDMIRVENSDLILYLGIEHIDDFLSKGFEGKNSLALNDRLHLIEGDHDEEEIRENEYEHREDEHNHAIDPHVWTSSTNAVLIAEEITKELTSIMPSNKEYFEGNLESFKNELNNLASDFRIKNENRIQKSFIVFHDAYEYLFEELGILETKMHIFRPSVITDMNATELKDLIDTTDAEDIEIIYREPQFTNSNLESFAEDYSLNVYVLDPLGADNGANGYINNYKENLNALEYIYE